jgi:hypothetical protein
MGNWVDICGFKGEIGFDATGIVALLICSLFWLPVVTEIVHHQYGSVHCV